ncbi:MAG: hypothetical protein IJV82_05700 [Oscillospiraceae bacterium]|nr:hypothetical protein [Oscillospiraceae bacterium]
MSRKLKMVCLLLAAALLSGCSLQTVDQLYCLPKRSEEYDDLQSAIDRHMGKLSYCAPLAGENPQSVQMADLDGDGEGEYLVFAKGNAEKPLHILIFRLSGTGYVLSDTIVSAGSAFDLVEYARIDDRPGYELVVGRQVSDQLSRSVSVYRFTDGKAERLLSTNYTRFLTYDMNADGRTELMVLRPGESAESGGIGELYSFNSGQILRSNQVSMSESVDRMKRIVAGKLQGGQSAVYVASAVGETAIVTDVFALVDDHFTNISFSSESGTSVQTLRNYYVFADDIDNDGVVELPNLITMHSPLDTNASAEQYLIRWFAMTASGEEVEKCYTYHDFQSGWYVTLDKQWAARVSVVRQGNSFGFYVWNPDFQEAKGLFTIYAFSGEDRQEQASQEGRFTLLKTESTVYCAYLEVPAASYGITQESLIQSFRLIHQDWKTGET